MPHIAPWFPDAKFGVFIHWVLKAVPGPDGGMVEWTPGKRREQAMEQASRFTAADYDPREWARMFKSWGAKYAVLTTKHHIGFTLYDCPEATFSAATCSPAGRDLVAPYVEALRAEGLKVGLYFSLPDWSHPDFPSLTGGRDPDKYGDHDDPVRWQRFLDDMFAEVRHLCTAYGKIDLLWFDGDWERSAEQWRTLDLAAMIQELQPHVIMNNRLRHITLGHYGTPESAAPLAAPQGWWEFCATPGDNWDGIRANQNLKPVSELVRMFGDTLGMGGNLLLNVAPDAAGGIPECQVERMAGLGSWITSHAEMVHGSEAGLPAGLFHGFSTHKGGVLYLATYDAPRDELVVKGLQSPVKRVTHLRTGRELAWRRSGGRANFGKAGWLFIRLPADLLDDHATAVRVEFEDDVCEVASPQGRTLKWKGRPDLTEQAVAAAR